MALLETNVADVHFVVVFGFVLVSCALSGSSQACESLAGCRSCLMFGVGLTVISAGELPKQAVPDSAVAETAQPDKPRLNVRVSFCFSPCSSFVSLLLFYFSCC